MDENAGASRKADPTRDPYSALAGRRKIRGGTRSCHECKRRKAKCQFLSRTDTACVNCRRRGTPCVSQEFEGDASDIPNINPIVRVESLLQKVLQRLEGQQQVSPDSGVDLGQPLSTPRPPVSVGETPEVGVPRSRWRWCLSIYQICRAQLPSIQASYPYLQPYLRPMPPRIPRPRLLRPSILTYPEPYMRRYLRPSFWMYSARPVAQFQFLSTS
jgi:hypothetical protein